MAETRSVSVTGKELVEFAKEAKKWRHAVRFRPALGASTLAGGANEVAVCEICHRPFLYNGDVRMPETCGRDRCMRLRGSGAMTDEAWTLPPKTANAAPVPAALPDPVCHCICHLNAYQREWGFASTSTEVRDRCEHCMQPV